MERHDLLEHYELPRDGSLPQTQRYKAEASLRASVAVEVDAIDEADAYDMLTEGLGIEHPALIWASDLVDWAVDDIELVSEEESA
jgi:hypothetical protein